MKNVFFMGLLLGGISLLSCQNDLLPEPENRQDVSKENVASENVSLRAANATYRGYTSESYLARNLIRYFDASLWEVDLDPKYGYIVDHIEVKKIENMPAGYTAYVEDTPGAGYLPGSEPTRGIKGKMNANNNLEMTTCVYAVRTTTSGARADKYMPKIHTNSDNLQALPWNARVFNLIAHRGFHDKGAGIRENTVTAYERAKSKNLYGSEIDVWVTSDNIPVVYHDYKFYDKEIVKYTYNELTNPPGEVKLPKLTDFLQAARNSNTRLVLDIKPRPGGTQQDIEKDVNNTATIMDTIRLSGIGFTSIDYLTFSKAIYAKVAQIASGASVYLLIDGTHNQDDTMSDLNLQRIRGVSFGYEYLKSKNYFPTRIVEAKNKGMKVNVWTVDDISDIKKVLDAGADNISTDNVIQFWQ